MTGLALSVIVPTWNEERCIDDFIDRVSRFLDTRLAGWEIVVVDDGSTDGTVARVQERADRDPRVRILREPHRGKGGALRTGMIAARGAWRLMADADLSVSPEDWSALLDATASPDAPAVIVASREAPGSKRVGETAVRHSIGRVFNMLVQAVAVPGINDTQCGFKLFRADAVEALFPNLTVDGFAFDVELLFLARCAGFSIHEVGVVWVCRRDSRVRMARGASAFVDVIKIRLRDLAGGYRHVRRLPSHS